MEGLQQEVQMLVQQMEQLHRLFEEAAHESSQAEEKFMGQERSLKHLEGKIATNYFFQEAFDLSRLKYIFPDV